MKVKVKRQQNANSLAGAGIYNVEIRDLLWSELQYLIRACDERDTLTALAQALDIAAERAS